MLWSEAKESTLRKWTAIEAAVGASDPVDFLAEVNAVCALCDKAKEEAGGGVGKCDSCLLYQQVGGCKEFGGRLSERVAARDWPQVRTMVGQAIEALRSLEVKPEAMAV
jgi:hypothetical protein